MPRPMIRHIAIYVRDPLKLADFYKSVFDMDIQLKHTMTDGPHKGLSYAMMTDGHITLALLEQSLEGDAAVGINHFGFKIDNQAEIDRRLVAAGAPRSGGRPSDRPYAERRARDLEGNMFDLSVHGYERSQAKIT